MTKEKLESYRNLQHKAEITYRICQKLEKEKHSFSVPMDDMPRASNRRTLEDVVAEYDSMSQKFHNDHLRALNALEEIREFIEGLDNELYQNILRLKYIEGKKWWQVAKELNYSREHLQKMTIKIFESVA